MVSFFIRDDHQDIFQLKGYLSSHFYMKNLGLLRYRDWDCLLRKVSPSQRKYIINLLEETGRLESKPINTLMNPNIHFDQNLKEMLADPEQYKWLIGKLIYLTVTRPDILLWVC